MATALFMKMIIELTGARNDQEHIEMVIYNNPAIPDRTDYILGRSKDSPVPEMIRLGKKLEDEGVELIAIPCITANYFYAELTAQIKVPIVNMIREACGFLKERGIHRAGLMATSGTVAGGLFQDAFAEEGLELVLPEAEAQEDIMNIIYKNVKANLPVEMDRFDRVAKQLRRAGAETILLGCTELSVVKENHELGPEYLDVMRLAAKRVVEYCGK